ncbi:MAG: ABC transporter permease [Candidatus Saccharibacteria bacterium]
MSRIIAIMKKEFLQIKRDRMTLAIVLMIPLIQIILFGYAIQTEVKHIPTVVFDQSLSQESRDMLESFTASGYFDVRYVAGSYTDVNRMIDKGDARVGIVFPPDFARDLKRGTSASVQVLVDASDSMVSNQAIATANSIGLIKSQEMLFKKMRVQTVPYDVEVRPWYNPDGITAYYMVPGICGIILTLTMMMLTAVSIVRERERGTLEQLLVTPMKSYELMVGKTVPYIALGYIEMTVAILVGVIFFGLPIKGSLVELYVLSLFFIIASLGLGIAISTIAKTQMQAFQMSFFVMLPSILLSGFMFPRAAMPKIIYYISDFIPLTFYLDIIRGIILKGIGFSYLMQQVGVLLLFSLVFMTIASLRFKKKIA